MLLPSVKYSFDIIKFPAISTVNRLIYRRFCNAFFFVIWLPETVDLIVAFFFRFDPVINSINLKWVISLAIDLGQLGAPELSKIQCCAAIAIGLIKIYMKRSIGMVQLNKINEVCACMSEYGFRWLVSTQKAQPFKPICWNAIAYRQFSLLFSMHLITVLSALLCVCI